MNTDHSVTLQIANLRQGNEVTVAQQFIWDRYFARLAALANKRLSGPAKRAVSGEDVAISVLATFFDRISKADAFPKLEDRRYLWPLLATIAQRRAINTFNREMKEHLDGRVRGESILGLASSKEQLKLDNMIAGEVTPESADQWFADCAEILDELKRHDQRFDPPTTRYYEIAILTLQGFTTTEIAEKLNYANKKTVERSIAEIRVIWKCLSGGLASILVRSDSSSFESSLSTEPLVLGRQRKGEPDPIWDGLFNVKGATTRRLILTNDKRVSRNHCKIQIRDESKVVVANDSRKSEILVESEQLPVGESRTISGDCRIVIPGFTIKIALR